MALTDRSHEDEDEDEDALLSLLPIAKALSRRYKDQAGWLDWEDLRQEGMIGALRALRTYEARNDCSLGEYAGHFIRGAITHAIRDRNHWRPGLPRVTTTADQGVFEREQGCTADHPHELLDVVMRLPPKERAVIALHYYGGVELREISQQWGGDRGRASKIHRQALARLRAMLEPTPESRTPTALERRSR